ncbi:hypothetical protein J6590_099392, partial [Homalodisca vitripennis]
MEIINKLFCFYSVCENRFSLCPDLLAEIDLRVPANTRSRDLLGRRYHSTNFDFNSPFARFIRLGNRVASGCDLFFDGLHQVRRQAFSLLSAGVVQARTIARGVE